MSKVGNRIKAAVLGLAVLTSVSMSACSRDTVLNQAGITEIKSLALIVVPNKNRVDVLDMQTNRVTQSLQTDQNPSSIAASPDGRMILVTNTTSGTVSVFLRRDNETFQQLNSIGNGKNPVGVAFNPNTQYPEAYVAYEGDSKLLVLDTSNQNAAPRVTRVLNLTGSNPKRIVVSKDGNRIFVTDSTNAKLIILTKTGSNFSRNEINLNTNGTTTTPNSINLEGMVITDDDSKVFIANNSTDSVLAINVAQGATAPATISLKDNQIVNQNPVGPRNMTIYKNPQTGTETLYVAGYNASVVSVIDVKNQTLTKNILLGGTTGSTERGSYNPVGVAVGTLASKEDVIYVTNTSGLTVSLIDPVTNTLKRNFSTTTSAANQDPLGDIVSVGPVK